MDSKVPYSLSDIHLPGSPGDNIKSSSKTSLKKEKSKSSKLKGVGKKDDPSDSDSDVCTNGVKAKKLVKKNLNTKTDSDCESTIKKNKSCSKEMDSNSPDTDVAVKNLKKILPEPESKKLKETSIEKSKAKIRHSRHSSGDHSASTDSDKKTDIGKSNKKINSHSSSKQSNTENSSSGEDSSHSETRKKKFTKKVHSPKHSKRRKESSSSSSSSRTSRSSESNDEIASDGEISDTSKNSDDTTGRKKTTVVSDKRSSEQQILNTSKQKDTVESIDPSRKKLKINRNNVVIPNLDKSDKIVAAEFNKSNKSHVQECNKSFETPTENQNKSTEVNVKECKSSKIQSEDHSSLEIQNDPVSPNRESSESVEREMGEIIENIPEVKYEPRKLKFPGRKLSSKSTEEQCEEPKSKKSKWGKFASSQKSAQTISISTDSLKSWFPDFKLVNEPTAVNELTEDSSPIKDKKLSFPLTVENDMMVKQLPLAADKDEVIEAQQSVENTEPTGPVSKVVFIQNLVRPFTLLQLKDLLKQTGNLVEEEFWIDKIKSKCFATYATEDEAIKTRNALNGARWPASNPKILIAEFSTEEELELHRSGADASKPVPENIQIQNSYEPKSTQSVSEHRKRERETEKRKDKERYRTQAPVREWDKDKVLQESPDRGMGKESTGYRSSDKKDKKDVKKRTSDDTPAKLLDDLFQKTKSVPCIYWLPLTEIQLAQREEDRRLRRAEREKKNQEREQDQSEQRNKRPRRETDNRRSSTRSRSPTSRRR